MEKKNQTISKRLFFRIQRTNTDSSAVVQEWNGLHKEFIYPLYIYIIHIYISTQFQFKLQISRVFHYTIIGQDFWDSQYYLVEHEEDNGIAALSGGAHGVLRRVTRVPTTINKIINDKMQCVKRLMKLYCCNI